MNQITTTAMRDAFEKATRGTEVKVRTATYAMIRSALNRRIGTKRPKTGWSFARRVKRV